MKKIIIASLLALSLLIPVAAEKVTVDYNKLAESGTETEIKDAAKADRFFYVNLYNENKESFLHLCLKNKRPYSIIRMCIDYDSDVNAKTKDGRNTISYAAEYSSDPETIKVLVKASAIFKRGKRKRILQADEYGKNAFHYAKKNPAKEVYAKLCEFADDPNVYEDDAVPADAPAEDSEARTMQAETSAPEIPAPAAESEVPAPVPLIAAEDKSENAAEEPQENTESPAEQSATDELLSRVEEPDLKKQEVETYASAFLLDYAEDPKEEPEKKLAKIENPNLADKNGVTLLMKAAKAGNDWDVRTLLASGADVNLRDKDGWTALMYAARYQNNLNIINMLIEKGAYVRVRNKFNATPLLMAADYSKNPEILSVLLKNRTVAEDEVFRAFIFCITGKTNTSHVRAAKVKIFLDMDVPLNRLWKGQTPLMYAAQYSSTTDVIGQLLDAGADPSLMNEKGMSAFDYAKNNKRLPQDNIFWALNSAN